MTYEEYSTLEKAEQLIQMAMRDADFAAQLGGTDEERAEALALVGLTKAEMDEVKAYLNSIKKDQTAVAWW